MIDPQTAEAIGRAERYEEADEIARRFHEVYERLAHEHGYVTREATSVPYDDLPVENKGLMIAVVGTLLSEGTIRP